MTEYVYSGHHVIAEYRTVGQSTTLVKYVYGPGIDRPVMMVLDDGENETKYYFHQDRLGSIIALSDENGDIVEGYTYDAFGSVVVNLTAGTDGNWLTPDGSTASYSQVGNPYYFTGRRLDPETGLYYYRSRYYHPTLGRFLQADPIGYAGGLNLYGYCGNDPVNCVDPMGLAVLHHPDGSVSVGEGGEIKPKPYKPLMNPLAPLMSYQSWLNHDPIVITLNSPMPVPASARPKTKSVLSEEDLNAAMWDCYADFYKPYFASQSDAPLGMLGVMDTRFFADSAYYGFNGEVYSGHELNYIGVGMGMAHRGWDDGKIEAMVIAWNIIKYHHRPSRGEIRMALWGANWYYEGNLHRPRPNRTNKFPHKIN